MRTRARYLSSLQQKYNAVPFSIVWIIYRIDHDTSAQPIDGTNRRTFHGAGCVDVGRVESDPQVLRRPGNVIRRSCKRSNLFRRIARV